MWTVLLAMLANAGSFAVSVDAKATTSSGGAWDALGGAPDLAVCELRSAKESTPACLDGRVSDVCKDNFHCTTTVELDGLPTTLLVFDQDLTDRHIVGVVECAREGCTVVSGAVEKIKVAALDGPQTAPPASNEGPPPLAADCYRESPCCDFEVDLVIVATETTEQAARKKAAALASLHGWENEPEVTVETGGYDGYLPPAAHPWRDGDWSYLATLPTDFLKGLTPNLWVVVFHAERPNTGRLDTVLSKAQEAVPDAYRRKATTTHCVGGFH